MQKRQVTQTVPFAAIAAFTLLFAATLSFAQEPVSPQIDSNPGVESSTGGTLDDALFQSLSGTTIPLTKYTFTGSRVLIQANLWGATPSQILSPSRSKRFSFHSSF